MFEVVDLTRELAKDEYKKRISHLQGRLWELQRAAWRSSVPTVIVFEGWYTAGISTTIRKLTERLEPRALQMTHTVEPRTHELPMPWLYRFWNRLPNWGEMAIFDRDVRSATVRALGDARVLTVDKKNFMRRVHEDPSLAFRLVETMSRRIRELGEEVARLQKNG